MTLSSLLVEGQHWHRRGSLFDRTTAGNERVRRLVHRFAWECPQAVRSHGEREFNLEVLLWWIAKEAEAMPPLPTRDQLPPVTPLLPIAELGRPPKPGNRALASRLRGRPVEGRTSAVQDQPLPSAVLRQIVGAARQDRRRGRPDASVDGGRHQRPAPDPGQVPGPAQPRRAAVGPRRAGGRPDRRLQPGQAPAPHSVQAAQQAASGGSSAS